MAPIKSEQYEAFLPILKEQRIKRITSEKYRDIPRRRKNKKDENI